LKVDPICCSRSLYIPRQAKALHGGQLMRHLFA
jgi:hypothetical protein